MPHQGGGHPAIGFDVPDAIAVRARFARRAAVRRAVVDDDDFGVGMRLRERASIASRR
jgi:hypothetical protein